jgi:hypothetical protein
MTTAKTLLQDLRSAGYVLRAAAGKINVQGDEATGLAITPEVKASILANRSEVLALLEAEEAERVTIVSAQEWIDDLVAKGQLPAPVEPQPSTAPLPDGERRPLPASTLRRLPDLGIVARVHATADRLGRLIGLGLGGSPEAHWLAAERAWIEVYRPDAWRLAHHQPPLRQAKAPPLASLDHVAIGDMTPTQHWEAIGGSDVVEAIDSSASHSLRLAVIMSARDGPGSAGERDYHRLWRTFTTGEVA